MPKQTDSKGGRPAAYIVLIVLKDFAESNFVLRTGISMRTKDSSSRLPWLAESLVTLDLITVLSKTGYCACRNRV
jgi:hypothetical protein